MIFIFFGCSYCKNNYIIKQFGKDWVSNCLFFDSKNMYDLLIRKVLEAFLEKEI